MTEDNHFVAHPEGGITTEAALAEQANTPEVASEEVTPEVASDPTPEVAQTTEEQPGEEAAPETTETVPETTEPVVEPEGDEAPVGDESAAEEPAAEPAA